MMHPRDPEALPTFLSAHADDLPQPDAALALVEYYRDELAEMRAHPNHGNPFQPETPSLDGPATLERISGRLDGLFIALRWLALPLAHYPDYNEEWRP